MQKILPFLLIVFLSVQTASALDCQPYTLDEAIDRSTLIFSGKLIESVEYEDKSESIKSIVGVYSENRFEVLEMYKGSTSSPVMVIGQDFKVGEEYLVYAAGEEGHFATIFCGPSKLLANAAEDLEKLDPQKNKEILKLVVFLTTLGVGFWVLVAKKKRGAKQNGVPLSTKPL